MARRTARWFTFWVLERMGVDEKRPFDIEAYEVYLPGGETFGGRVNLDHVEAAKANIGASVAEMRTLLADPEQNIGREADFPAQGTPGKCAACAFREVCDERVTGEDG